MTLTEFSAAWNELRNAALGRGVQPLVPEPLATDVGTAYEGFRVWVMDQPGELPVLPLSAGPWVDKHRELAARVRAYGIAVQELPRTMRETLEAEASTVWTGLKWLGVALGVGIPVALVLSLRGRR